MIMLIIEIKLMESSDEDYIKSQFAMYKNQDDHDR